MNDKKHAESDQKNTSPWKRIAGQEIKTYAAGLEESTPPLPTSRLLATMGKGLAGIRMIAAHLFIALIHRAARSVNKPVVDIGREYSVSVLNDRINTLEEILVRQWTQIKDDDLLAPSDEVRQYIAACHIARQYDRITTQLVSSRLGISQAKSEQLIDQLVEDEVITESYSVTYHDVRRSMIDATIERKLAGLEQVKSTEITNSTKKH